MSSCGGEGCSDFASALAPTEDKGDGLSTNVGGMKNDRRSVGL
jgi:hypothetical protein